MEALGGQRLLELAALWAEIGKRMRVWWPPLVILKEAG